MWPRVCRLPPNGGLTHPGGLPVDKLRELRGFLLQNERCKRTGHRQRGGHEPSSNSRSAVARWKTWSSPSTSTMPCRRLSFHRVRFRWTWSAHRQDVTRRTPHARAVNDIVDATGVPAGPYLFKDAQDLVAVGPVVVVAGVVVLVQVRVDDVRADVVLARWPVKLREPIRAVVARRLGWTRPWPRSAVPRLSMPPGHAAPPPPRRCTPTRHTACAEVRPRAHRRRGAPPWARVGRVPAREERRRCRSRQGMPAPRRKVHPPGTRRAMPHRVPPRLPTAPRPALVSVGLHSAAVATTFRTVKAAVMGSGLVAGPGPSPSSAAAPSSGGARPGRSLTALSFSIQS